MNRNVENAVFRLEYVSKSLAGYLELEKNPPGMMRFAADEIEKVLKEFRSDGSDEQQLEPHSI